jgi:5-formaminoimidazole-4-carboxamide-1-beta-D-ribofuranosyl 5'-monophosphate synthetase
MSNTISIHGAKTISAKAKDFDFGTVLTVSIGQSSPSNKYAFETEFSIFGLKKEIADAIAAAVTATEPEGGE